MLCHELLLLPLLAAATVAQDAGSTFGHARARELAELGRLPTTHDVVVRDLVNYHRHRLPLPKAGQDVALDLRFDRSAGLGDDVWLQVGYTTAPLGDRALAAPCSVAIVVDCSGSMAEAGKMTAVQAGLRAFVDRLRQDDEVALVAFSSDARTVAARALRGDGRWLHDAIDRLRPDGSTNLHAGLMRGIQELATSTRQSRRVVVLTDGIANAGITGPDAIVADAQRRGEGTIDISTIGVGANLDVPLLQRLASGARGLFHFVADGQDVQKVFVTEAEALLAAVARRVSLRVELPRGLRVVQALHEGVRTTTDGCELDLPDVNAGATGVVMLRCRADGEMRETLTARSELRFHNATGSSRTERAEAELRTGSRDDAAPDTEVRRNAAIAVLAQGLADTAQACDARRWADADRALRLARDEAQRLFPGQDDDLRRVQEIAAGHANTLRRYVDRFREL
jgi:Ca-activated chloride channel family protein